MSVWIKHLSLPVALFVMGGAVAKYLDATAGVAIVGAATLLFGRLMPQPTELQKDPPA